MKFTLLMADVPGLLIVKVSVEVPPGVMVLGEKALSMEAFTIWAMRPLREKSEL